MDFLSVMPALTTEQATALLFFSVALAEETLRLDTEPQDLVGPVLQRAVVNIKDGFLLVQYIMQQIANHPALANSDSPEVALCIEAMSSWKVSNPKHALLSEHLTAYSFLLSLGLARCPRKPPPFQSC